MCSNAVSGTVGGSEGERLLLLSEIKLAQKPQPYFVFDLKGDRIYLKARGIVLKEFAFSKMRCWGQPDIVRLYTLIKKTSLLSPRRENIEPEKAIKKDTEITAKKSNEKFKIKALELEDMPANYGVTLDEDVSISVRSGGLGLVSGFYAAVDYVKWYAYRPISAVWDMLRKKRQTVIYIVLNENDARALYWAITGGTPVLLYNAPGL